LIIGLECPYRHARMQAQFCRGGWIREAVTIRLFASLAQL
jgi:hypothetical protein